MQVIALIVLFTCLAVGCLAQRPLPCRSPPLLVGSMSMATQSGVLAHAKYSYDAFGQRIRFREVGLYQNKTFHIDVLMLFRERVLFKINYRNHTCTKRGLNHTFHPMEIPRNSTLLGQVILGTSSRPGEGLLVNSWVGEVPRTKGKYVSTFTEFSCLPVSSLYYSEKTGWVTSSFFDIVLGIEDPQQFFPPSFCHRREEEEAEEEEDFFSAFL